MERALGVGEMLGSSLDAVLRRPFPAVAVALFDLVGLVVALLVFGAFGDAAMLPGGYRLTTFPYAIPEAMPSVADVHNAATLAFLRDAGIAPALAFLALMVIVTAYAEGGFIALLMRVYEDRADAPVASFVDVFAEGARRHFRAFLVYRLLLAGLAIFVLFAAPRTPYFTNYALGAFLVEFLVIFAPCIIVKEGSGPVAAIRGSVRLVADHLGTSLVMLLFLLLATGGASVLLGPLQRAVGEGPGLLAATFLYAPIGTALALFVLRVYLSFKPDEPLAEPAPAPSAGAAPA
ncbi:MAG TPA: hypothetical protein VM889_05970 [Candidatus Thermoplasmatota archaeon]|nr:hypothetical protein [Candidatus Thermoplasmatota archaeon]